MIISFGDLEIRKLCEDEHSAIASFGRFFADKLFSRISDLMSSESIHDLPVGNPQPWGEFPHELYKIDIDKNYILVFCASNPKKTYLNNGHLDWSCVSRIKLLKIEKS